MKLTAPIAALLALLSTSNNPLSTAFAQGTAFTYQGRLNNNGQPASGSYDLQFTLFATNATGAALAGPVTNPAVAVTNGLFTTMVDFGNALTGASNWLELAVSTNGANIFTTLAPRQQLTPVPYAMFANTASNLLGSISAAQLPAGIITNGAGGVNLSGTFAGSGGSLTGINAAQLTGTVPAALLPPGTLTNYQNAALSYIIKPVGSYTDHQIVFTNLQECFNAISNSSMTRRVIETNYGNIITAPPTSYAVHLDAGAICYSPSGFKFTVNQNCFVSLDGDLGATIMGDSNVLTCIGVNGTAACLQMNVHDLQFVFLDPYAKTMAVYLFSQVLDFHDNIIAGYPILQGAALGIWAQWTPYTNSPGMIGLMGFGVNNMQDVHDCQFFGLAVDIIAPGEHWRIWNNQFSGTGYPAGTVAWTSADQYQIVPPGVSGANLSPPVLGWQMAFGEAVYCEGKGDTEIFCNHFSGGGIYWQDNSSLGPSSIFYNAFEGVNGGDQSLIVEPSFPSSPTVDFWGNGPAAAQSTSIFSHNELLTLSNLTLFGFTSTAGFLDPTLNGTYRLQTSSVPLDSLANFSTAFAVWTNLANTDARIFLNDAGSGGAGALTTSNFYSGGDAFYASVDGSIFDGQTPLPITPDNGTYGFQLFNGTGFAAPGSYYLGTNPVTMQPQTTITNFAVLNGATSIASNGTSYFLHNGVWTNAYSGTFSGNGDSLTGINAGQLTGTLPAAQLPPGVVTTQHPFTLNQYAPTNTYYVTNCPTAAYNTWFAFAYLTNGCWVGTNTAGYLLFNYPPGTGAGPGLQPPGTAYDTSEYSADYVALASSIPCGNWVNVNAPNPPPATMFCYGIGTSLNPLVDQSITTLTASNVLSYVVNTASLFVNATTNGTAALVPENNGVFSGPGGAALIFTMNRNPSVGSGNYNLCQIGAQLGISFMGGTEWKTSTNNDFEEMYYIKANPDWQTRAGGGYLFNMHLNDWGQTLLGWKGIGQGYAWADTNILHGPAFVSIYGQNSTTNCAALWMAPGDLTSNAVAGDLQMGRTNLFLTKTNLAGDVITSPLATLDDLTNGNLTGVNLNGSFSGSGSGLTNLNAAQLLGPLSTAQLPPGVVTSGLAWTPNGMFANQYQITLAETNWVNLVETFWTNSAGSLIYTNKATNGLTVYLVYNDPNWVSAYQSPVWTIQTNYPDAALSAIYISSGNAATPVNSPLGVGVYQFNGYGPNSSLQVLALQPSLNGFAIQTPALFVGYADFSNSVAAPAITANTSSSNSISMYNGIDGETLEFIIPANPGGALGLNQANVFFSRYAGTHVLFWENKLYTNGTAILGYHQAGVTAAPGLGHQWFFPLVLNAQGQALFGCSDIIGGGIDPDFGPIIGPGVVSIFNNATNLAAPSGSNSAALWMQPQLPPLNPTIGNFWNDGTNWYVQKTNATGLKATSQLITRDDLTNGASAFAGNGSGLTSLNAAALAGTVPAGSLPGITTNVSAAGITLYITNGLIMRVSTP